MQLCSLLLIGTSDSIPMEHCSTKSQGVASASNNVGLLLSVPTLAVPAIRHGWNLALATPWDSVEQCSIGTLSLVPRSKVASSGPTFNDYKSYRTNSLFNYTSFRS